MGGMLFLDIAFGRMVDVAFEAEYVSLDVQ